MNLNHRLFDSDSIVFRARIGAASANLRRRGKSFKDPAAVLCELVSSRCTNIDITVLRNQETISIQQAYNLLGDAPFFMKRQFESIPAIKKEHIDRTLEIWNELKKMRPDWKSGVELILRSHYDEVNLRNTLNKTDEITAIVKSKPTWRAW